MSAEVSCRLECYAVCWGFRLPTFRNIAVLSPQGQGVQGTSSSIKDGKFLDRPNKFSFSRTLFHGIVRIKVKNVEQISSLNYVLCCGDVW